jgi:acyl-[acyl-carrier-protein]-phospholipid O-acyltransferase/long-chain-fatty-acid--[acyl-carrier-protein] ligase
MAPAAVSSTPTSTLPADMSKRLSYFPRWLELVVAVLARSLYRVRVLGAAQVPAAGGLVLIANHLSYADVVALQLACPRPLRFLGYEEENSHRFFKLVFRLAGVVPISPAHPTEGMRRAIRAAKEGEVVCIFPEGHISRTSQLTEIKEGFAIIARRAGVPVVPAAIDGLWGSLFSFSGNTYLWKAPRLRLTDVTVAFGPPLAPADASAETARQALLELGADAFAQRPLQRGHLGREVVRSLARRPGRLALVDRTAARRALSAGQVLAAGATLGRRLRSTVAERRVGIVLPPGAGAVIANLAVLCAGKVPVNLNFTAGRASMTASLRVAGIRTVLTAEAMRARLADFPWPERTLDLPAEIAAAGGRPAILGWLAAAWLLPNPWVADLIGLPRTGGDEEAALLFTSGSAGEPRGVVLTHRNLLANCAQFGSLSCLRDDSVFLGCLPIFHSFGFTVTLWYPLLRGRRLVTSPSPLETRRLVDAIRDEGVTVLVGAPTFVRPFLRKAQPDELRSLRTVVTGAEKLPDELYRGFRDTFGIEIIEGYGLTEASPVTNVNQPNPPVATATAQPQVARKNGTVGRLLPGVAARITDPETGAARPLTESGLLWLRGANLFPGYLDQEGRLEPAREGGWFATWDLGRFDAEGFLTIEGRRSRFSKIGGEMVPHGTIEERIVELFALDQSEGPAVFVAGLPDPVKGENLILLTVAELSAEQIREKLSAAGLPNLWIPKLVRRVAKIPVLGSGKLDLAAGRRLAIASLP